ncbi:MAG: Na/Pi symporter [Bacteroidales bacterium]|nr:Na/Pi symporter [Bacteroidales bacterium]
MSITEILLIAINFAGALAVFLFAMKMMSEGLQKGAGSKMRAVLGKITNTPLSGILTGTAVTAAIQSTSATTLMVVSFVNAGLLSLSGYGFWSVLLFVLIGAGPHLHRAGLGGHDGHHAGDGLQPDGLRPCRPRRRPCRRARGQRLPRPAARRASRCPQARHLQLRRRQRLQQPLRPVRKTRRLCCQCQRVFR